MSKLAVLLMHTSVQSVNCLCHLEKSCSKPTFIRIYCHVCCLASYFIVVLYALSEREYGICGTYISRCFRVLKDYKCIGALEKHIPQQNGQYITNDIFKWIWSNIFPVIFQWSIFVMVQFWKHQHEQHQPIWCTDAKGFYDVSQDSNHPKCSK